MGDIQVPDYYYGDESSQFSFYRIPGKTEVWTLTNQRS